MNTFILTPSETITHTEALLGAELARMAEQRVTTLRGYLRMRRVGLTVHLKRSERKELWASLERDGRIAECDAPAKVAAVLAEAGDYHGKRLADALRPILGRGNVMDARPWDTWIWARVEGRMVRIEEVPGYNAGWRIVDGE